LAIGAAAAFINLPLSLRFAAAQRPRGPLFIVGGAFRLNNEVLWHRLIDLAGGAGAKIAVMPTAAAKPLRAGEQIAAHLNSLGCAAFVVPVSPRLKDIDVKTSAADPVLVDQIKEASGVYFVGGQQGRITESLLNTDGSPTPVLEAIFEVWAKGGVIAGSSAGAAIMSQDMFKTPPSVLEILKDGIEKGKSVVKGLGFLEPGWMVDQHFLARGRLPRLLVAMEALGYQKAVGVDENAAIIVQNGIIEAAGHKGAVIIDLSRAQRNRAVTGFNLTGARITYLDSGDKYEMDTRKLRPRPEKKVMDPWSPNTKYNAGKPRFHGNILGKNAVLDLMSDLIESARTEMTGLAYSMSPGVEDSEKGFAFRFYKDKDSIGYYAEGVGSNDYTIENILLDVFPVRLHSAPDRGSNEPSFIPDYSAN
jgi:cyanophycinase